MRPMMGAITIMAPFGRISSSWSTLVLRPWAVRANRCPPVGALIRTRSGRRNSSSSITTAPSPLKFHSNRAPSPGGRSSSRREERIVGFQLAKLPQSTMASNTSSIGALMTCERVITGMSATGSGCGALVRAGFRRVRVSLGEPLLISGDRLVDRPQEVIRAAVADIPELPFEIGNGLGEAAVRAQVSVESSMLIGEFDNGLGVVNGRLDLDPTTDDAGVGQQPRDVVWSVASHRRRIEPVKGLPDARPLGVDHPPIHPGLKHRPAQRLQVPGEIPRPAPRRRFVFHEIDPH